jgi:hypothetical protein
VDAAVSITQAFEAGAGQLGPHRVNAFAYVGQRPTVEQTTGGAAIPGAMTGNKPFYRVGAAANFNFGTVEVLPLFMHARDDAHLGTGTPADQPLPAGAQSPEWNAGVLELHFIPQPQLLIEGRAEVLRMSRQADPATPRKRGDTDAFAVGFRAYPFMFSRAGLSVHGEYGVSKTVGRAPLSGDGAGVDPLGASTAVWSHSVFLALDFAF